MGRSVTLCAPFPYFGGKSKAAALIWSRLGEVENYVEPFFGSGAVLLARPTPARIETVNDKHGYLANFWRAIQQHPRVVARYADGPVNEADLHARHRWLVAQGTELHRRLLADPEWCDPKIAGWWVWGASCWIGSGWCDAGKHERNKGTRPEAHGDRSGSGIHGLHLKRPDVGGGGAAARSGSGGYTTGRGVHAAGLAQKRPHLTPNGGGHGHGRGVAASGLSQQVPVLRGSSPGGVCGSVSTEGIYAWFEALSQRLRRVRVCCGDWSRVMGPSVIYGNGVTGIVLDPPYAHDLRAKDLYAEESGTISGDVRRWAIEHGDDPRLRIALCGYEGEHEMPASWACVAWKANGGYGNVAGNQNKHKERIWFSPHCLRPELAQRGLFGDGP